jgi:hypothetical protein
MMLRKTFILVEHDDEQPVRVIDGPFTETKELLGSLPREVVVPHAPPGWRARR